MGAASEMRTQHSLQAGCQAFPEHMYKEIRFIFTGFKTFAAYILLQDLQTNVICIAMPQYAGILEKGNSKFCHYRTPSDLASKRHCGLLGSFSDSNRIGLIVQPSTQNFENTLSYLTTVSSMSSVDQFHSDRAQAVTVPYSMHSKPPAFL